MTVSLQIFVCHICPCFAPDKELFLAVPAFRNGILSPVFGAFGILAGTLISMFLSCGWCHIHFLPAYLVLVLFLPSVSLCSLKLGSGKAPFLTVTAAEIFLLRFVLPFAAFIKRAHRQENVGMWIMTRWIRIVDCQIGAHPVCDKLVLYEVRQQRLPLL